MPKNNFAVFILSYGRCDRVFTYDTLRRCGYTGDILLVCSDDDSQLENYKEKFSKENIYVFSKREAARKFDIGDNFSDDRVVVFARNICMEIAHEKGYEKFVEMDDDYKGFYYRKKNNNSLNAIKISNLDKVFELYFKYLDISGATSIAFAQAGDFMGGVNSGNYRKGILRKLMNVYFCDTKKPFNFYGRLNEDTTTYVYLGGLGNLFLTPVAVAVVQKETQQNEGGLTDIYIERGTYFKTFYSVMWCPSCVKISAMGSVHRRIHHKVLWENAVPKIISERFKKAKNDKEN